MISQCIYRPRFGALGRKTTIFSPLQLDATSSIHLGERVFINHQAWLMGNRDKKCTLIVEDGTVIGHFSHIIALENVHIGKNVLIADKVFISDCSHEYADVNLPVIQQPVKILSPVSIGDGSWIGENVCILGASVGKHCVIGSNSVVTRDIPDYAVAVGNPARVIKQFDFASQSWVKAQD